MRDEGGRMRGVGGGVRRERDEGGGGREEV